MRLKLGQNTHLFPVGLLLTVLLAVTLAGCDGKDTSGTKAMTDMVGKEIVVPESLRWRIVDSLLSVPAEKGAYTILTYIDSTGCAGCRMKLKEWNRLIDDLKRNTDVPVDMLMVVDTRDSLKIKKILKNQAFRYPVCIDSESAFNTYNRLPEDVRTHTMLLGPDNRVMAIGNPVTNPKILDIYRQSIKEDSGIEEEESLTLCDSPSVSLGLLRQGTEYDNGYLLTNRGTRSLTVRDVIPSCDCVSAKIDMNEIHPGQTARIDVSFHSDTVRGSFLKYIDIFFNEEEKPQRLIFHGYIE